MANSPSVTSEQYPYLQILVGIRAHSAEEIVLARDAVHREKPDAAADRETHVGAELHVQVAVQGVQAADSCEAQISLPDHDIHAGSGATSRLSRYDVLDCGGCRNRIAEVMV